MEPCGTPQFIIPIKLLNSNFFCPFQVTEKITEGSQEFSGLKEEINKLVKQENKFKADRLELVNNISKVQKAIDDLKVKIPGWNREVRYLDII